MRDFLIISVVLSVGLTVLLNLMPRLFPNATDKAVRKAEERLTQQHQDAGYQPEDGQPPANQPSGGVKVFFPWKAMLIGSVLLTVVLNLGRFLG